MSSRGRRKDARKSGVTSQVRGGARRLGSALAGFLFGRQVDERTADRLQEIKGLGLVALSMWLAVSMLSYYTPPHDAGAAGRNWGGAVGFFLANGAFLIAGWAGYLAAVLCAAWGIVILARKEVQWPALRLCGAICFVLSVGFLLQLGFGPDVASGGRAAAFDHERVSARLPYGPGGWIALEGVALLEPQLGVPGLWIFFGLLAIVSFMLATEMAFYPALAAFGEWLEERRESRGEGLFTAVARWTGRMFLGLWDFLRGADLEVEPAIALAGPTRTRGRRTAAAEGRASGKSKARAEESEDEESEDEDEEEDDDEEEDEEEDEDGKEDEDEGEADDEDSAAGEEEDEREILVPAAGGRAAGLARSTVSPRVQALVYESPEPPPGPWTFPSLDLLELPSPGEGVQQEELAAAATKLEHALASFRVEAEIVAAQVGPAVTLFELTVAQGTRMNKVTQLSQEIAAALKARSVRIIAPIPGRSTIGIEVPNKHRRVVRLRELINQKAYDKKHMALPFFLGMDAEGTPIVEDLSRMPHLLIAGTTGSGKSVCINTILASLLLTRSPHDVQMILVDPKMVELQIYANVPHLLLPVVTDARQATNVLNWAVEKMEGRYELMKDAGVKNVKAYNALGEEGLRERLGEHWSEERTPRHMPYIVVVIDEMADLMMVSKKEAEGAITRLAQKSRAVGIHVIVATQRPSTDVITGVLKGNLPTRIGFQVASKVDSRVILDAMGAEKLLGGGDMLYTPPQSSQLKRVQGALVEDHELQAIVDFVCNEAAPRFNQELVQTATGTTSPESLAGERAADDPMFDEAVRVVLKSKRGSASLLQRALSVGYTRASRLIDLMTEEGILGDHRGSKSREILVTLEQWEARTGESAGAPESVERGER